MRDRILQKEEKKQKKSGASTKDSNNEDGILRDAKGDVCCCIPYIECTKKGTPLPTKIEDGVKLCCTNDCIFSKNPVHIDCYDALERGLINMLEHQRTCKKGVIKAWLDSSAEPNLWSKKGLEFIQKTIRCPCGKGQMFRDEDAWMKREQLILPSKDKKDKKTTKPKAALPALTLTVKKGAAPPPGFHDLDNHYLSSRSPPATAKLIEDKYGSPPPETKAKKVRHTSTTSTEKVYSPKPQNVFTFGTAAVKTQPPKPEPSTKVPIGYRPVEPMVVKTFEGPKYSEVLKTAEEPKPCQDIRAPETEQPKAVPPVMDINELLQSCEINNLEDDSSSEDAQDSSEEEEEDQNNDYLQDNQTTTTSETSSINSYPNDRVSISIQTEETSFSQSAYGSHRLYSASQSYIWNPAGDSNAIVNPNNERFDDYSLRRFAEESSARKTSNSSSPFNQSFYKQEEELFSPPKIIFLFRDDETFAVEVHQNGRKEMLRNGYGNEWTPMYLSMAGGSPVIGEDAKDDYQKLPNSVAYDILKVIGKPIHVIKKIYPKPKNNILLVDDTNCFVIETPYVGNRPRPEEMILAAFLKIMKEKSEKYLKTEVKSIYLSTNFELTDFQKAVFIKSASLLKLEIVCFTLND
jgi:hypothetical protein